MNPVNDFSAEKLGIQEHFGEYLPGRVPSQASVCQLRQSLEVFSPGSGNKPIICKRLNIDHNFIVISY